MLCKSFLGLIVLFVSLQACGGLRTELYREETLHGYQNACKLYEEGDYTTARTAFQYVIAMDPDYGPAHAALGHLALIREDYAGALTHYQAGIAADPELEADLQPFIMVARAHKERAPLRQAGAGLDQLYPLIMADRWVELETILAKDMPLQLLASDTMGIPPGRWAEMQRKIAQTADPAAGSVRYRLFAGYLLFFGQTDDDLAAALIKNALEQVSAKDRPEALIVLGQLHERRGDANAAVEVYLAAVDAGLVVTAVAHHLARVYGVAIERILPPEDGATKNTARAASMRIEIATQLPQARAVDLGAAVKPKDVQRVPVSGSRYTF